MATINGGAAADTLSGTNANDIINGLDGDDTLTDAGGNDKLDGGKGNDKLAGGVGNDTYFVDSFDDVVEEIEGQGKDTVFASTTFALGAAQEIEVLTLQGNENIDGTGNKFANTINGNAEENLLIGAEGNDVLNGGGDDDALDGGDGDDILNGGDGQDDLAGRAGNNVMSGGKGDDLYFVDSIGDKLIEAPGQGDDTVRSSLASFTLGANLENAFLVGSALDLTGNTLDNQIKGNDLNNKLSGGAGGDRLIGNDGNDTLDGGAGGDELDGGSGNDSMTGGTGNDLYQVDSLDDKIVELANGGTDFVVALISGVTLAANLEQLTLAGAAATGSGNDLSNALNGNNLDNELDGGKGNDRLDGDLGNDTLRGGLGNDTYIVGSANDVVEEIAGQGKDTIFTSVSYTLAAGQAIEVLTLTDTDDVDGKGNELANTINGNAGQNLLEGGGGNDVLIGGAGNDTFDGGAGNDVMIGGKDNDFYKVDSAGDKITELANQGIEEVFSSLANFKLGANLERLELDGAGLNGTGNTLSNRLTGNALDNKLDGGAGNDDLFARAGNDTLIGGAGNDLLFGDVGDDKMTGGTGNDTYDVSQAGDSVIEAAGGGTDEVRTILDGLILGANVENLTLLGNAGIDGTGNDLNNFMIGNDNQNTLTGGKGNDTLDGGKGADELIGGLGNDTYFVDDAGDAVVEVKGGGKDTVKSSVNFTIAADQEIETLILTGAASTGTGNDLANAIAITSSQFGFLFGNGGNDLLTGGVGNDELDGGDGNDVLDGGNGGVGEDALFGRIGNDTLKGGNGNDTLDGGAGNDVMAGGTGDDTYVVEQTADKVTELANQGHDTVESHVASLTLGANLEDLILEDGAVNGTGNGLANFIKGNEVANKLDGGTGNDILLGRDGEDDVRGGTGNDVLLGEGEADTLKGGAGNDTLDGGVGADILFGEAGNDTFRYAIEGEDELPELGGDIINGFQSGADKIDLGDLLDDFDIDPVDAFANQHVLFGKVGADTLVQFDSDGAGGTGPVTLATVINATLTQSDFILISDNPL